MSGTIGTAESIIMGGNPLPTIDMSEEIKIETLKDLRAIVKVNPRARKYWALRKWRAFFKGEKLPVMLDQFVGRCSYCTVHSTMGIDGDYCCSKQCPVINEGDGCEDRESIYRKWSIDGQDKSLPDYRLHTWLMLMLISTIKVPKEPRYYREEPRVFSDPAKLWVAKTSTKITEDIQSAIKE